jgi:hypothetical protein
MPAHRLTNRHEDWDERGHIAAHDVVAVRLYLLTLLRLRSSARARGRRLSEARRHRMSKQIEDVLAALLRHHMSFDMATRPRQEFDRAPMKEPWQELDESVFVKMTRFYKKEFVRICDALELIPDTIRDSGTGCKATKKLAVFILLRRWAGAEHWCVWQCCLRACSLASLSPAAHKLPLARSHAPHLCLAREITTGTSRSATCGCASLGWSQSTVRS